MIVKQFKKDYISYLLGIILPASISFLTIPILKNILGTANFGTYSYYASILIIINASFSGGISQGIIRLQIDSEKRDLFYYQSLCLVFLTSILVSIPLFIFIQLSNGLLEFSLLVVAAFFVSNLYISLLAITQSRFLALSCAISESARSIIFVSLSFLLLIYFPAGNFLDILFMSLVVSYGTGCIYLLLKNKSAIKFAKVEVRAIVKTGQEIFTYGGFLIGWFFCSYGLSMANRFIIARHFGKESIGHFTASFDIINKSIILLLSPIYISLFPVIIKAFSEGEHGQVRSLIRRLTLLEGLLLLVSMVLFRFFAFPLLSQMLNTPANPEYLWIDLQVICSTFIWQMAILQHKYLELRKKTAIMLLLIFISLIVSVSIDSVLIPMYGLKFSGIGFLTGGITYFLLVVYYNNHYINKISFSWVRNIVKNASVDSRG